MSGGCLVVEGGQSLDGLDPAHVRALEAVADVWPPMKVVSRKGRFILVDGFHRYAAAQNLGLQSVWVLVIEVDDAADLRTLSFSLNAQHGRPLTLTDRRTEAARVLQANATLADREIGRRCGLSQPTVAKVRAELEAGARIEQASVRVGRDGSQHKVEQRPAVSEREAAEERLIHQLERVANAMQAVVESETWTSAKAVARLVIRYYDNPASVGEVLGELSAEIYWLAQELGYDQ